MKPVDQTTFGVPGGNCLSACIASLLELRIEDVPYFMEPEEGWYERLQEWLKHRGFYCFCFDWTPPMIEAYAPVIGYHILTGRSARGPHCVVGYGDKMVHDPSPAKAGLIKVDSIALIIPLDPSTGGSYWKSNSDIFPGVR